MESRPTSATYQTFLNRRVSCAHIHPFASSRRHFEKCTGVTQSKPSQYCVAVWEWTRTLQLKQPNGIQPLFISLFTPVLFPLWQVNMSSVEKTDPQAERTTHSATEILIKETLSPLRGNKWLIDVEVLVFIVFYSHKLSCVTTCIYLLCIISVGCQHFF